MKHAAFRTLLLFSLPVIPYALMYALWPTSHLFLPDDAYYYFEVARNIAAGHGSTFDRINLTNGYHPLWCLVLSAAALLPLGKTAFVVAAMLLCVVLVGYALWLAWRTVCPEGDLTSACVAAVVATLLMWNFYISKVVINGLESSLLLAAAVTLLWLFTRWLTSERGIDVPRAAALGAMASIVLLSRLDSFFYFAAMLLVWIVRDRAVLATRWRAMLIFGAIPAVTLVAYMAINQQMFGIWMPVSGYVKRIVRTTGGSTKSIAVFAVFVIVVLAALRAAVGRFRADLRNARDVALVVVSLFVVMYHGESSIVRGLAVPEIWYLSQHVLWAYLVLTLVFVRLIERGWRWRIALAAVGAAACIAAIGLSWTIRLQPTSYDAYLKRYEAAEWINANLPADAILAGWDVGIAGYYADARLINLDGLVNSFEYAQHMRRGDCIAFMDRCGVEYIVQYYPTGFEDFAPRGFDWSQMMPRLQEVVWTRMMRFASLRDVLESGRRTVREYPVQVRRFARPPGA